MMRYAFNGFLFSQRPTGVMRFAYEMLLELDHLEKVGDYELVVPVYATNIPDLKNIKIIKYGSIKGNMWEQISFSNYLRKNKKVGVNFNNTMPLFSKGIITIHDLAYKKHPEYFKSLHGRISVIYHRAIFYWASKGKMPIFTVSYFSRDQIINEYGVEASRINVIGNGWQHMERISQDEEVINKYSLERGKYYFTLGSVSEMKNTEWVINASKDHPSETFVISGGIPSNDIRQYESSPNVIFTGFITNEEMKTLLKNCKAFIYPSKFDGFGIPPLEALSQGAEVICSNAACLPEVYGSSVRYIDPYDSCVDFDEILKIPVCSREDVLNKYSWKKTAIKFNEVLVRFSHED